MVKKVSFSNKHLELNNIASYYNDSESSLKLYYSKNNINFESRFLSYTKEELKAELHERISELNHSSSLSLLASLEAVFRIDYLLRNYSKKKDSLSKVLRELYKEKQTRASLENDILNAWKNNTQNANVVIGNLKGAFKYRHWLAHGRYWEPKMGRNKYDYNSIFELARTVTNSFPFEK